MFNINSYRFIHYKNYRFKLQIHPLHKLACYSSITQTTDSTHLLRKLDAS
jgi:hypothetical protein